VGCSVGLNVGEGVEVGAKLLVKGINFDRQDRGVGAASDSVVGSDVVVVVVSRKKDPFLQPTPFNTSR